MSVQPDLIEYELEEVVHVVDGDTFDALVSRTAGEIDGWTLSATGRVRIRLVHLDTPERGEPGYAEATRDLEDWLYGWDSMNGHLRVLAQVRKDSFGRLISDVYEPTDRSRTASDHMVRERGWPVWTG